jgi:hypothetical protein
MLPTDRPKHSAVTDCVVSRQGSEENPPTTLGWRPHLTEVPVFAVWGDNTAFLVSLWKMVGSTGAYDIFDGGQLWHF